MYKPLFILFFIIGFSSLVWGENANSALLPSDRDSFTTIQKAIDAAFDGEKVLVPPGTYVENLDFGSKQIVLESVAGPSKTILQAKDKLNSVVIIRGSTISGFTITGGTGKQANSSYGSDYYGGGIYSRGESVIERCIIHGNGKGVARKNAGTFAGGVYAGKGSSVTVRDSLIYDNYAWACGGAVLVDHGASIKIENSTIFGNDSTNFFGHQGGVGMANGGKVEIVNSIVWGNSGDEIGAFSGIYSRGTEATVSYSLVERGFKGTGNISSTSPFFSNSGNVFGPDGIPGTGDDGLRLTSQSPVIGKAMNESNADVSQTDLCGYLRVQGEGMDMGCYEFGNALPPKEEKENNLQTGLVAYYPFDGDTLDYSGNEYHGKAIGASLTKDRYGEINRAYNFDGIDDYIEAEGFNWTNRENATISMWSYYSAFPKAEDSVYRMIFGMNNEAHCLFLHRSKLYYRQGWGNGWIDAPTEKKWYHFVLSWSHVDKKVCFFLNGQKIEEHTAYQNVGLGNGSFRIGANDRLKNYHFQGQIDDIRIYDRALSSNEVTELYELEKAPQTPEEIISAFSLRMVEIDSKRPVALGYPKFDEIEVSLPKFKISGETVTFGIWSQVRQAAEKKLGWELAEGLQGSGYDDTNENHPVTKIGFLDATLWCNALSKMAGLEPCYSVEDANGKIQVFEPNMLADAQERGVHFNQKADGIRIPTGNEWEVAARGGLVGKKYPWGNEYPGSTRANWYVGKGMPNTTTEVGSYPGNGYGLFDMAGGVWEMTWDDALQPDLETPAVLSNTYVNRGGAWNAGWSPEVSTNGWSIRFGDRRHEFGFRVAANGASMGKAPPPIGPPTGAPEPLVDYIKLLREIIEEIAGVETELKDLVKRVGEKDAEIEKLEGELVSITGQIDEARTQLKECHDDCNRTREEIARVQKDTLSQNLEIARLEGELRASVNRLNSLRNDRDQVTAQITELEKQMEEADVKMGTAHTPGWHYVPTYGWLWTSPEHYPLIFSNEREGWVYYERGTSDPWLYYDYNSEKWEQWFHDAPLFSSIN